MGNTYFCSYGITDISPVGLCSQSEVWVFGRVCCDSAEGKMNEKSVALEGSRAGSGGARVLLELKDVSEFALFPGQLLLVCGVCADGAKLVASKIITVSTAQTRGGSRFRSP